MLWDQKNNNAAITKELIENLKKLEHTNAICYELNNIFSLSSTTKIEMLLDEYNLLTEEQLIKGLQSFIDVKNPMFLSTIKTHVNCLAKCEQFLLTHPDIPEFKEILQFIQSAKNSQILDLEPEEAIESSEHQNLDPRVILAKKQNNKDKQPVKTYSKPKNKYWFF